MVLKPTWVIAAERRFGVTLAQTEIEQFDRYEKLLQTWNKRLNLTAIVESEEIQRRHFLDSLSFGLIASKVINGPGCRLIDMGTGGGLPGLALKIAFPELHITLADSVAKKVDFLKKVVEELGLENIDCVATRAEDAGRSAEMREQYDIAIARSVAYMPVLAEYLLPLVKIGGHMVALKGERALAETQEGMTGIKTLGGELVEQVEVSLSDTDLPHYLVVIKKIGTTPDKFPRRAGVPKKRPLISS